MGHRCRGARVDGAMVPLNTPLANGPDGRGRRRQGGRSVAGLAQRRTRLPARARARAPRCAPGSTRRRRRRPIARGRELVEKLLQREGRTAVKLDDAGRAARLQATPTRCSRWSARTSTRCATSSTLLRPPSRAGRRAESRCIALAQPTRRAASGGVLVVGVDSLLTTLARCCRPAPPDAIGGFVTRGKGVAIHRARLQQLPPHGASARRSA
ncbi:MAG: hypothetical protein MZW92_70215 [Comamonadaceae bacterium]|nr:hypothetical protein [Comamonadaceae bacterium]